ncbi:MAG: hypothetical protein II103_03725, partial [Treponema sp.]|nr:hypothetical protein [Treponema sp.]
LWRVFKVECAATAQKLLPLSHILAKIIKNASGDYVKRSVPKEGTAGIGGAAKPLPLGEPSRTPAMEWVGTHGTPESP